MLFVSVEVEWTLQRMWPVVAAACSKNLVLQRITFPSQDCLVQAQQATKSQHETGNMTTSTVHIHFKLIRFFLDTYCTAAPGAHLWHIHSTQESSANQIRLQLTHETGCNTLLNATQTDPQTARPQYVHSTRTHQPNSIPTRLVSHFI